MKWTQNDEVLAMLREHRSGITAMEAMKELGIMRLAARVNDLKDAGHHISSEMVKRQTRYGSFAHVALYRLIEEAR